MSVVLGPIIRTKLQFEVLPANKMQMLLKVSITKIRHNDNELGVCFKLPMIVRFSLLDTLHNFIDFIITDSLIQAM